GPVHEFGIVGPSGRARHASPLLILGALTLALASLVQEADEVLGSGKRLPALRKEVLGQDGAVRQLVDGDAPLVDGPRDLDLEVLLRGLVAHDPVVVEASFS